MAGSGGINLRRVSSLSSDWLRHGFSTRRGGVSAVYGGQALNLGWTKEDTSEAVVENRRRFIDEVGAPDLLQLVTARQVHATTIRLIRLGEGPLEGADGRTLLEADGLMTDVPGRLLGVGTADCVPVLVFDGRRRAVAAFHAGWRGTAEGIVEQGIQRMREVYGSQPEDLVAAVGPSIGSCCYAIGEEVQSRFRARYSYAGELFRHIAAKDQEPETVYLDLWEANRRQLLEAGVAAGRITVVGECTGCTHEPDGQRRYFSHRLEKGVTGRMLNVIGIAKS